MFNKRKMSFEKEKHYEDMFNYTTLVDTYILQVVHKIAQDNNINILKVTVQEHWDTSFCIKAKANKKDWNNFIYNCLEKLGKDIKNLNY